MCRLVASDSVSAWEPASAEGGVGEGGVGEGGVGVGGVGEGGGGVGIGVGAGVAAARPGSRGRRVGKRDRTIRNCAAFVAITSRTVALPTPVLGTGPPIDSALLRAID